MYILFLTLASCCVLVFDTQTECNECSMFISLNIACVNYLSNYRPVKRLFSYDSGLNVLLDGITTEMNEVFVKRNVSIYSYIESYSLTYQKTTNQSVTEPITHANIFYLTTKNRKSALIID